MNGFWRVVLLITIFYCPFSSFAADNGDAVSSSIGDASLLNPLLASDSASGDIVSFVFNGLVKYDKNNNIVADG